MQRVRGHWGASAARGGQAGDDLGPVGAGLRALDRADEVTAARTQPRTKEHPGGLALAHGARGSRGSLAHRSAHVEGTVLRAPVGVGHHDEPPGGGSVSPSASPWVRAVLCATCQHWPHRCSCNGISSPNGNGYQPPHPPALDVAVVPIVTRRLDNQDERCRCRAVQVVFTGRTGGSRNHRGSPAADRHVIRVDLRVSSSPRLPGGGVSRRPPPRTPRHPRPPRPGGRRWRTRRR